MPVLVDFPYSAGANTAVDADYAQPSTHTLMSPAGGLGTVFGVGYNRATNRVYASAFMKRHAGFGPNGPGAIYAVNPAAAPGGAPALFADLDAIFGAGTSGGDAHATNGGDYNRDGGNVTWNAVGKTSLGGLEVSPDGLYVFVVNLADRQVYRLPTTQPLTPATIVRRPVPVPASAVPASGADLRPFALQWFRGRLYVGMVNSAESTQLAANLRAYVYALDPATMTFAATPALEFSLGDPRGYTRAELQRADGGRVESLDARVHGGARRRLRPRRVPAADPGGPVLRRRRQPHRRHPRPCRRSVRLLLHLRQPRGRDPVRRRRRGGTRCSPRSPPPAISPAAGRSSRTPRPRGSVPRPAPATHRGRAAADTSSTRPTSRAS